MWLRGVGCFLYNTPEMVHVRNINKLRVRWEKCSYLVSNVYFRFVFFFFPVVLLSHDLFFLLQTSYQVDAKKNLSNYTVVLDTPEYNRVTELKTHFSDVSCFLPFLEKYFLFTLLFCLILCN